MKKIIYNLILVSCSCFFSCQKSTENNTSPNYPLKQVTLFGCNGIVIENDKIWIADLFGQQIIGADKYTGKIFATYTKEMLNDQPDDLCFVDNDNFVWTAPYTGFVYKTNINGTTIKLDSVGNNVNPITKFPNERAVVVGFSRGENHPVLKINVDNGNKDTLVNGIIAVNRFAISNNILYAPTNDDESIFGKGKLLMANLSTGTHYIQDLHFPTEQSKTGITFPTSVAVGKDGWIYMLQALPPVSVYKVNPDDGTALLVSRVDNNLVADNMFLNTDGKIYVTGFIGNKIVEIDTNGLNRSIYIKN